MTKVESIIELLRDQEYWEEYKKWAIENRDMIEPSAFQFNKDMGYSISISDAFNVIGILMFGEGELSEEILEIITLTRLRMTSLRNDVHMAKEDNQWK